MRKAMRIAYIYKKNDDFISNVTYVSNLLKCLEPHAEIIRIPARGKYDGFKELSESGADYLLTDIRNFAFLHFLHRDEYALDIPIIAIMHTVWDWMVPILGILPFLRKGDILIAPSKYSRDSFSRISSSANIVTVPHMLDVKKMRKISGAVWAAKKPGAKKSATKRLCYLGRMDKSKGLEALLGVMPAVLKKYPAAGLDIVGPLRRGTKKGGAILTFGKRLQKLARKLGISQSVTFHGAVFGDKKIKLISACDLFVYPTTYVGENLPVAMIEALACGLPVVTTDWASHREVIRDGENGFLAGVKGGGHKYSVDRRQLTEKILAFLGSSDLLKMRRAAYSAAANYDKARVVDEFFSRLVRRTVSRRNDRHIWDDIKDVAVVSLPGLYNKEFMPYLFLSGSGYLTYDMLLAAIKNGISGLPQYNVAKKKGYKMKKFLKIQEHSGNALFDYIRGK